MPIFNRFFRIDARTTFPLYKKNGNGVPVRSCPTRTLGVGRPKLISWRWSLPSPTNPVWWGSMHTISSYRGIRPTNKHTHRQDRLQYTAPQLSAQCNELMVSERVISLVTDDSLYLHETILVKCVCCCCCCRLGWRMQCWSVSCVFVSCAWDQRPVTSSLTLFFTTHSVRLHVTELHMTQQCYGNVDLITTPQLKTATLLLTRDSSDSTMATDISGHFLPAMRGMIMTVFWHCCFDDM